MADKKTSQLPLLNNPAGEDLLYIVDNPSGTPESKAVRLSVLFGNIATDVVVNENVTVSHAEHFTSANGLVTFTAPVVLNRPTTASNTLTVTTFQFQAFETPASSSITTEQGKVFVDENYLYVSVANNEIKRVALQSF